MGNETDRHYLRPYRESAAVHGPGFGVTLWASPETQIRRFEVFTQMCFLTGKRILDAGCSRGDFAEYLLKRDVAFERYIGVDALSEVIDFASTRGMPGCEFHTGDFAHDPKVFRIGQPQVICLSGSLNTMTPDEVERVLEAAWDAADEALLFNFLSARAGRSAPEQTGPATRFDPLLLLDWALSRTSLVAMRHDYFEAGHDATIVMRRSVT